MARVASLVRPVIGVSVGLWRGDEVLLVRRARPPMADLWSFPGGRLEPGEKLLDAARRELREETALEADIVGLVDTVEIITHAAEGHLTHHVVLALYAARWTGGEPVAGDDAAAARFATMDALRGLSTTAGLAGYAAATRSALGR